jgi:hypothetical protein
VADGEGGGAGAAGPSAGLGWDRLESGRRLLGALGERARGWRGGEFLAPVPEWIGELPGEDQRCLLFAAAEGLGAGDRRNALAACLGAGATLGSMEQRCFWLIAEMGLELDVADVRLLGAVTGPQAPMVFELALQRAAGLLEEGAAGAQAVADDLAERALSWNAMYRIKAQAPRPERLCVLRDAAVELAVHPPAPPEMEGPVSRDDGYGRAVIAFLGPVEDWPAGVESSCPTAG